jgi:hypothetical protein
MCRLLDLVSCIRIMIRILTKFRINLEYVPVPRYLQLYLIRYICTRVLVLNLVLQYLTLQLYVCGSVQHASGHVPRYMYLGT